jgi:hypothetical protein
MQIKVLLSEELRNFSPKSWNENCCSAKMQIKVLFSIVFEIQSVRGEGCFLKAMLFVGGEKDGFNERCFYARDTEEKLERYLLEWRIEYGRMKGFGKFSNGFLKRKSVEYSFR